MYVQILVLLKDLEMNQVDSNLEGFHEQNNPLVCKCKELVLWAFLNSKNSIYNNMKMEKGFAKFFFLLRTLDTTFIVDEI